MEKLDKSIMIPIGDRIREYRLEKRLTQYQMAELLDISPKHYSEIERGKTGMSISLLIKISEILDRSIDHIIKGTKIDNYPTQYIDMSITVPIYCYRVFQRLTTTQKEKVIKAFQTYVEITSS